VNDTVRQVKVYSLNQSTLLEQEPLHGKVCHREAARMTPILLRLLNG